MIAAWETRSSRRGSNEPHLEHNDGIGSATSLTNQDSTITYVRCAAAAPGLDRTILTRNSPVRRAPTLFRPLTPPSPQHHYLRYPAASHMNAAVPRFVRTTHPRSLLLPSRFSPAHFARPISTTTRTMAAQEFKLKGVTSLDLKPGDKQEVEVEGLDAKVLLLNAGGKVQAVGPKCTHYGAPLVKGVLGTNGKITCPWHGGTQSPRLFPLPDPR